MAYTTIDNPELYFQTKIYTGNNGSQSITFDGSENMQADLVWIKKRDGAADSSVMDSVRGVRKSLTTNNTEVEYTESAALSSFDSNGLTFDGAGFDHVNTSNTFVAWCWKEASGILDINLHTGNGTARTISHNLGAVPAWIVCKGRDWAEEWETYHKANGNNISVKLNNTSTGDSGSGRWNSTNPTSSVYSVGVADATNKDTKLFVTYLFAEIQGYSKFGHFEGNNNSNGGFCYLGFRPAFVMVKNIDTAHANHDWIIFDNKRNTANPNDDFLRANDADAETTSGRNVIDFLSNGFKARSSYGDFNSNDTYNYIAFAEAPFVNSKGVPCNAR